MIQAVQPPASPKGGRDGADAALARLTPKERECLRRRLLPQTAKEMAIDLGVSPHAVEKRLKMARTKLGLSSSLAAARMLARAEGYQPLAPRFSDLSAGGHDAVDVIAAPPVARRAGHPLLKGTGMIVTIALVALLSQDVVAPLAPPANAEAYVAKKLKSGQWRKADTTETAEFLTTEFRRADRDGSGFLDARELAPQPRRPDAASASPSAAIGKAAEPQTLLSKMDIDHDGKVSRDENVSYMMPWMLWQGIPANWRMHQDR